MVLAIIDIIYNMLYINNIICICGYVVYIYGIPPRFPPPRFPLSRPSTSPRLRVNDYGNDVDAAVHGVVGDNDDVDEGDDQGIQKEEEMVWAKNTWSGNMTCKSCINGSLSMAMLNNQRVVL